jgi:hypothetical protein
MQKKTNTSAEKTNFPLEKKFISRGKFAKGWQRYLVTDT